MSASIIDHETITGYIQTEAHIVLVGRIVVGIIYAIRNSR